MIIMNDCIPPLQIPAKCAKRRPQKYCGKAMPAFSCASHTNCATLIYLLLNEIFIFEMNERQA